ncbi:uncharacterized protein [Amphiura filiformis]|uniref:uncharacterized protein isoform X2 n=1 Tax=Amphiura filiformis TaxID=82378 RepID=UPI003B21BEFC
MMVKLTAMVLMKHRAFIIGSFIGISIGLFPLLFLISYHYQQQLCSDTIIAAPLAPEIWHPRAGHSGKLVIRALRSKEEEIFDDVSDTSSINIADMQNLLSQKVISGDELGIDGWWMSHSKWNATTRCDQDAKNCTQVFTTACRKQMTTAIYQFLPIEADSGIIGFEFSGKGSSQSDFHWKNKKMDAAINGAQTLLKYTDDSYDIARLLFPTGNYSIMSAQVSKIFPHDKQIKSITAMLTCYGYDGFARFQDIVIKPIYDDSTTTSLSVRKDRKKCVSSCPKYYKQEDVTLPFDTEKVISSSDTSDTITSNLTLVTHLSIDRMEALQAIADVWTGIMAVTIYVPVLDAKNRNVTQTVLQSSRRKLQEALKKINLRCQCDVIAVYAKNETDEYPTNHMRNIGINTKDKNMPLFDTRFSGYGFNKIQHTIELMHSGYSLQVLPNVWATHVYHRISSFKKKFLNGPITRLENRIKRYEYVAEIMRKYHIGPCAAE